MFQEKSFSFRPGRIIGLARSRGAGVVLLTVLLLTDCSWMLLREETRTLQNSTVLVGRVESTTPLEGAPIIVAAFTVDGVGSPHILHFTAIHEPGPYELMVPEGPCFIAAFADKNGNLRRDAGEAAGRYAHGKRLQAPPGGVVSDVDLLISPQEPNSLGPFFDDDLPESIPGGLHFTSPGAIAALGDARFSAAFGAKGLMAPVEFFREVGGNVYFLEEYDPVKTPVLFIHGAGGSPQNWRAFFDGMDPEHYQPWFFYYPSGASLDSMSNLLFWKMINLRSRYNFEKIHIVAHSMGGLIARSFIVTYGSHFPSLAKFISISTPWAGEELAELGVKYSPAVVPSWRDMTPGSPYIESLFATALPANVDYYLFFGHRGNRNIFRPNNDKAVTLASQLEPRAQADARMVYGFDEDHVSILSGGKVLDQTALILATADEATDRGAFRNRMKVTFSFQAPSGEPNPNTVLLLRSADNGREESWIYLTPRDSGSLQGPFTPGEYEVSLLAPAFVPEPNVIPVTLDGSSQPSVEFRMKPRGSLSGHVVGEERGVSQAGEPRKTEGYLKVDRVTLTGEGIKRTLLPLAQEIRYSDYYLAGTDFATEGGFQFFGLPTGSYRVSVTAEGYISYTGTFKVREGVYEDPRIIQLRKVP